MDTENIPPIRQRQPQQVSQSRKVNKPLMEKRRRERINHCLDELKTMLMEVTDKEHSFYSRLEKADILEMTVTYLRKSRNRQPGSGLKCRDPNEVQNKYTAGYQQCADEVTKYLNDTNDVTPEMKMTLVKHLRQYLSSQKTIASSTNIAPKSSSSANPLNTASATLVSVGQYVDPALYPRQALAPCQTLTPSQTLLPAKLSTGEVIHIMLTNAVPTSEIKTNSVQFPVSTISGFDATGSLGSGISLLTGCQTTSACGGLYSAMSPATVTGSTLSTTISDRNFMPVHPDCATQLSSSFPAGKVFHDHLPLNINSIKIDNSNEDSKSTSTNVWNFDQPKVDPMWRPW